MLTFLQIHQSDKLKRATLIMMADIGRIKIIWERVWAYPNKKEIFLTWPKLPFLYTPLAQGHLTSKS